MGAIRVEIVSAEIAIFSGEASMVVAPGKDGDLGIAPKHTPLLTTLRPGEIELHKEGAEKEYIYGPMFYDHIVSKKYKWFQLFPPYVKPEPNFRGWSIESETETPDTPITKDFNINIFFPANGFRETTKKIYNVTGMIIKGELKTISVKPKVTDAMKKKIGDEMLKHYNNFSI